MISTNKSTIVRLFAAAVIVSAFIATNITTQPIDAQKKDFSAPSFAGSITGQVFQDYNGNGLYDTSGGTSAAPSAVDRGLGGITVSAYDAGGVLAGSTATATNGTYTLSAGGTGPYRVEFTNVPATYFPSARSTDSVAGGAATNAGSTTQFVTDGATANVNLALNQRGAYCEDNPEICSQLYGVGSADQPEAVFTVPYSAGSTRTTGGTPVLDFQSPGNTSLASTDQVGTTFGISYERRSRRIFVASYMKKHAKFGPGGPGAIYQIDRNSGLVSQYVDLNTVFGAGTAGTDPHNPADYNTDNGQATWNAVGKISFGGMAISDDEQFLYTMNLANRRLYRIPTSGTLDNTTITSTAFPTTMPNCTDATEPRPFAVTWHEGTIYVGAVCSRETSGGTISTNLRAYVYRFDPTAMTFSATPDMNFQLNYTRLETDPGFDAEWLNWRTNYVSLSGSHFIYPQPMLTDIEFDRGNLVLSLRDRNGDQSGYNSASNPNNAGQLFKGITAGDILRACGSPALGWTLETNGRCGGIGNAPQGTNEGPGGGEYYYQENYHPNGTPHDEVSLGGAAQIPGHNVLVATIFDPVYIPTDNIYDAGGFRWMDNATGAQNRGYLAYGAGDFGKANGIGNVHPLCAAAPIEIGNRVWRDSNSNGVQDPGEPAIAGVTVRLYRAGVLVGTAVTDANGEYYFVSSTTADGNTTDNIGQVNGGILYNTAYEVRFDNPVNYQSGGPLFGMLQTAVNQTGQLGDDDASDSDAVRITNPAGSPAGAFPVIFVTTGNPGQNNHTFDVGFRLAPLAANVSVTGRVATASGRAIRGVSVILTDSNGNVRVATSSTFGYYRFSDIPAGQVVVVQAISSKRYTFDGPSVTISANDDLEIADFIASEY